jgi:hypothetical protein
MSPMVMPEDESRPRRSESPASVRRALAEICVLGLPEADAAARPDRLPRRLEDPRFRELVEIVNLAIQVHGAAAHEWFVRPEAELGFVLPATLLRDPANGRLLVKQTLMNHLRGPYAVGADGEVLPRGKAVAAPAEGAPPLRARRERRPKGARAPRR